MDLYDIIGNLAFLLIACSFLVRDILWLRALSVIASLAAIVYNYYVPVRPLWIVINWNIAFILINAVQIAVLVRERVGVTLTADERDLHESLFAAFAPFQFAKLMRVAHWRDVPEETVLVTEGQQPDAVTLVFKGRGRVLVGPEEIAQVRDGDFIGEMSFTSGAVASATVVAASPMTIVRWRNTELHALLERNPELRPALQLVLGVDMAAKLRRRHGLDGAISATQQA